MHGREQLGLGLPFIAADDEARGRGGDRSTTSGAR
jgi:hypothetical protein